MKLFLLFHCLVNESGNESGEWGTEEISQHTKHRTRMIGLDQDRGVLSFIARQVV